jgi:hypothetical protein
LRSLRAVYELDLRHDDRVRRVHHSSACMSRHQPGTLVIQPVMPPTCATNDYRQ